MICSLATPHSSTEHVVLSSIEAQRVVYYPFYDSTDLKCLFFFSLVYRVMSQQLAHSLKQAKSSTKNNFQWKHKEIVEIQNGISIITVLL